MKHMLWFFARIFTLCLISLTHLAFAQCTAVDEGGYPSNNGPTSFWQLNVTLNDNVYRTYNANIASHTSNAYTDCNCSYNPAAYLYSVDYTFNFSSSGSVCYLSWDFSGPFQSLSTCSSGLCSSGGEQQTMFEGDYYGSYDTYGP